MATKGRGSSIMVKKKWLLTGAVLASTLLLVACSSGDSGDVEADVPEVEEGISDEREHVEEFDIDFENNDEFEELDEDFTDLPAEAGDVDDED